MPVEEIFRKAIKLLRSKARSKIVHITLAFVTGFALVYCLNFIGLNPRVIAWITTQGNLIGIWVQKAHAFTWISFNSFTPDVSFLSDVIAFQGAVIAIAYPLSLEIVSRISERYSSNVITKKFSNEWPVRILPYLLIANVIIAISLKFFYAGGLSLLLPKALAWLTITIFLLSTILLIIFFNTLRDYAVNSKHLIEQLLIDMKKLIKLKYKEKISERELSNRQNKLIAAFEGTGDVLSFEVSRRRGDKYLIQTLKEMRLIIKEFLDLKIDHPEEFERLLLPPEFYEEYRNRPRNAQLLIHLRSEDYFITFTSAISQFSRIHEIAIEAQNLEVGKPALYNFIQLLRELSEKTENYIFIKQVLNSFSETRRKAVAKGDMFSAYTASISWYTNIVFNRISNEFELSYLDLFNEYFFRSVQFLISQGSTEVYEGLISSLVEGLYRPTEIEEPDNYKEDIKTIISIEHARTNDGQPINEKFILIDEKLNPIITLYNKAVSLSEYNSFANELDSISEIEIINEILKSDPELIKRLEKIKSTLLALIKIRNLDGLIIAFGAYCLFKQRYDYIKYMWEFNQPPDSDALWCNPSIVPTTIEGVIAQYSMRYHFEDKVSTYWDDHHGAKVYFDKYFLLLLLRTLPRGIQTPENLRHRINSFHIPVNTDFHFLNDLMNLQDRYISLAGEIRQTPSHIRELGLDTNQIDLLFDEFLIPFLRELTRRIENYFQQIARVKTISKAKVQEFRGDFKKSFSESSKLRDIFIFYNHYRDRSKETLSNSHDQLSSSQILDKEDFFEDWYKITVLMGADLGRLFASGENDYLINKLVGWSTEITIESFSEFLNSLGSRISNIFIIAVNSSLNSFIRKRSEFKSKLTNQELVPENAVDSLVGWLTFCNSDIPVYEIYSRSNEKLVMILNKDKLATVIQKPPQEGWYPRAIVDSGSRVEFFYIGVNSFSSDPVLMSSFLENPPLWLEKYQGKANQRDYLETRVLLEINEAFDFLKDEQFEGYVMRVPSRDESFEPMSS